MLRLYVFLVAGIAALCNAQSSFSPLRPPALPLAAKSPYMSTWQQAGSDDGNGGYLAGQWPVFWYGTITGWTGYIRVDNITYIWMGDPVVGNDTNYYVAQQSFEYTATKSIFTMDVAGLVQMLITFTSPVLPDSILDMSLPYSYMHVKVSSLDGKAHDVQLYTDISAEWVAGDKTATAQWSYGQTDGTSTPEAVAQPLPAEFPSTTGAATVYATNTEYHPLPTASINFGTPAVQAPGEGHHYAGQTKPPANADTHSNSHVRVKTNANPGGIAYHEVWRQQQLVFAEYDNQAEWGYWYYATDNIANLTYQQDQDVVVRGQFIEYGFLNNSQNDDFRAINDDYPVFGFAIDMGEIHDTAQTALFQISLHQEDCILFESAKGNVSVPCMWTNYFANAPDALGYFYNQYSDIVEQCTALDTKIKSDSYAAAPGVEEDYWALTALATRQAFATLEYTNTPEKPWIFMEEISSDGDIQTVDVIMPFHPILIYMNATLLKYMLDPLLINQEAGYFPFVYSLHGLGLFPNATGYNNVAQANSSEEQPVEESGNMLIMSLAYAQRADDDAWLAQNYDLLKQWADYLVNNTLYPGYQLSTDDFLGDLVNDTNLAVKGIIAIEAMAQIANRTGHVEQGINFTLTAHDYIEKWYDLGFLYNVTPPHEISGYNTGNANFSLLYNIFGDKECGLELVKPEIYKIQSDFYPTVFDTYGPPLRNTVLETKVDWEMWCASMAEKSTKNQFISVIAEWLRQTPTSLPFTDLYNTTTGNYGQNQWEARPVVGGMFSLLALESAPSSGYVAPTKKK